MRDDKKDKKPLKIAGDFEEVLKLSVNDNSKPKQKKKKKGSGEH